MEIENTQIVSQEKGRNRATSSVVVGIVGPVVVGLKPDPPSTVGVVEVGVTEPVGLVDCVVAEPVLLTKRKCQEWALGSEKEREMSQ
ncbi:hypothetical protein V2J09_014362 [Rumex salicifolius]